MKRKRIFGLVCFVLIFFIATLHADTVKCSCGSHPQGFITTYYVYDDNENCCLSTPVAAESAIKRFYEADSGGVYHVISTEYMTNTSAQNSCCP